MESSVAATARCCRLSNATPRSAARASSARVLAELSLLVGVVVPWCCCCVAAAAAAADCTAAAAAAAVRMPMSLCGLRHQASNTLQKKML